MSKLRLSDLPVYFSEKYCANCNTEFSTGTDKLTEFPNQSPTVTNYQALCDTYKAEFSLNNRSQEIGDNSTSISMCPKCTFALSNLHGSFVEFTVLSSQTSHLRQLIENTQNWIEQQLDSNMSVPVLTTLDKQWQLTDESGMVVKQEPLEMEILPDIPDDDFYNNDPLYSPNNASQYSDSDELDSSDQDDPDVYTSSKSRRVQSSTRRKTRHKNILSVRTGTEPLQSNKLELGEIADETIPSIPNQRKRPKNRICTICSKGFRDNHDLRRHLRIHSQETEFTSAGCPTLYVEQKLLYNLNPEHSLGVASDDEVQGIGLVPSILSRQTSLINKQLERKKRRLLLRKKKRPIKDKEKVSTMLRDKICTICSKGFRDSHDLRRHAIVHTEERKFACTLCPKAYKERKLLNRHLNAKHGVGGKLPDRTCNICFQYFATPYVLKSHIENVHSTEKPFCCEICGNKFPSKHYLHMHTKTRHEANKDGKGNKCEYCEKILSTRSGLKTHIEMVHLKEKKYACEICPRRFYRPDYLKEHRKTHDPTCDNIYKCKYCDATFSNKKYLPVHENKHVMGSDKLCSHCGASFKNKTSLDRHIASRHTDGESLSCELCGKTFKLREYLLQHMRSKTHGGLGHYAERLKNGTTKRVIPKLSTIPIL